MYEYLAGMLPQAPPLMVLGASQGGAYVRFGKVNAMSVRDPLTQQFDPVSRACLDTCGRSAMRRALPPIRTPAQPTYTVAAPGRLLGSGPIDRKLLE